MDLYLQEQKLRDEVIYLHSLWRQGPPKRTILPLNDTNFHSKKHKNDNHHNHNHFSDDNPWPSPIPTPTPTPTPATAFSFSSAWPDPRPIPVPSSYSALMLQRRASSAFAESFANSEDDGEDNGDAKYRFFQRVFTKNGGELRRYYEQNYQCGEFRCFICCGFWQDKRKKKFKTCESLAQHAAAVAKTKAERSFSHAALGQVVCDILGWDFDRLPLIFPKGEPLGRNLPDAAGWQEYRQPPISSSEWKSKTPVNNSPLAVSERPAFKPRLPSQAGSISAEEQAEFASKPLQLKATKACQEFLASRGSGSGESNNEDEEEDPSEESDECDSENEEEDLSEEGGDEKEDPSEDGNDEEEDHSEDRDDEDGFVKLFMEDSELRDFYVKNYEDGEFCCLVCGGIEEMLPKSFRGCVALVQHSIATLTTNKKLAHRAYGQAICQILGWDFNIFPLIISIGESLGQTLSKLGNSQGLNQPLVSGSEWPRAKPVENSPSAVSEWPPFTSFSASGLSSLSAEEQAKFDVVQLQHKAVKACLDFLKNNSSSNDDEGEDEDDDEDASEYSDEYNDEDENTDASNNSKEFNFFSKLFKEDKNLREFYVKNFDGGEFCCLVCGGMGKVWKRYIGCVALVQHSTSISNTKKKLAHRAYGKVICQVLGWDFNRFPSIVMSGESYGQSFAKLENLQGEPSSLDGDNGETILEKGSGVHLNDTSTTCELHTSNSHAESLAKSAELQDQPEGN